MVTKPYKILVRKPDGKRLSGRCEDNIKMYLNQFKMNWIHKFDWKENHVNHQS